MVANKLYEYVMSNETKQKIIGWMTLQGFVRSNSDSESWEVAWGNDSGYGYVTLHAYPHDYGWLLSLRSRDQRVNFGTIRTTSELMAIYGLLSSMSYERWNGRT